MRCGATARAERSAARPALRTLLTLTLIWAAVYCRGLSASPLPSGLLIAGAAVDSHRPDRGRTGRDCTGPLTEGTPGNSPVALFASCSPGSPGCRRERNGRAVGHEAVILASTDQGASWNVQHRAANPQGSLLACDRPRSRTYNRDRGLRALPKDHRRRQDLATPPTGVTTSS
jgi:hypothetical protein